MTREDVESTGPGPLSTPCQQREVRPSTHEQLTQQRSQQQVHSDSTQEPSSKRQRRQDEGQQGSAPSKDVCSSYEEQTLSTQPGKGVPGDAPAPTEPSDSELEQLASEVEDLMQLRLQHQKSGSSALDTRVAGVSFDGRQSHVSQLQVEQRVLCVAEPSNPYDTEAVRVQMLGGHQLGYIPRDVNCAFTCHTTSGVITGYGQRRDEPRLWGCQVRVQTRLPALVLDLLPPELQPQVHDHIKSRTRELRHAAQRQRDAGGKALCCSVLGTPLTPSDIHLIPFYTYDYEQRTITPWLYVVGPEVAHARQLATLEEGSTRYIKALLLVVAVNAWARPDLAEHVAHVRKRQQVLRSEGWTLAGEPRSWVVVDNTSAFGERAG